MYEKDTKVERYLYFHQNLGILERNWNVIRDHLLCIQASPLHAIIKIFLLAISVFTIFLDTYVVIFIILTLLPTIFILNKSSAVSLSANFEKYFTPNQERWEDFSYYSFCTFLSILSVKIEEIACIISELFTAFPLFALVSMAIIIVNTFLIWVSLTFIRLVAITLIVSYTTPVLWYYQFDILILKLIVRKFIPIPIIKYIINSKTLQKIRKNNLICDEESKDSNIDEEVPKENPTFELDNAS